MEFEYVNTPKGIGTSDGTWFNITENELRNWAGKVFDVSDLKQILMEASSWARLPEAVVLFISVPLLAITSSIATLAIVLICLPVLPLLTAPLISRPLFPVTRLLQSVPFQALYFIGGLTLLAWSGNRIAALTGLAIFVVIRLGFLRSLVAKIVSMLRPALYKQQLTDIILRTHIGNIATAHGISVSGFEKFSGKLWGRGNK